MPKQNTRQDNSFDFERELETLIRAYLKKSMTINEIEEIISEVLAVFLKYDSDTETPTCDALLKAGKGSAEETLLKIRKLLS